MQTERENIDIYRNCLKNLFKSVRKANEEGDGRLFVNPQLRINPEIMNLFVQGSRAKLNTAEKTNKSEESIYNHCVDMFEKARIESNWHIPYYKNQPLIFTRGKNDKLNPIFWISSYTDIVKAGQKIFKRQPDFIEYERANDFDLGHQINEPFITAMHHDLVALRKALVPFYTLAYSRRLNQKINILIASENTPELTNDDFYILERSDQWSVLNAPLMEVEVEVIKNIIYLAAYFNQNTLRDYYNADDDKKSKFAYAQDEEGNQIKFNDIFDLVTQYRNLMNNHRVRRAKAAGDDVRVLYLLVEENETDLTEIREAFGPFAKFAQQMLINGDLESKDIVSSYYKITKNDLTTSVLINGKKSTINFLTKEEYGLYVKITRYLEALNPDYLTDPLHTKIQNDITLLKHENNVLKINHFLRVHQAITKAIS